MDAELAGLEPGAEYITINENGEIVQVQANGQQVPLTLDPVTNILYPQMPLDAQQQQQ